MDNMSVLEIEKKLEELKISELPSVLSPVERAQQGVDWYVGTSEQCCGCGVQLGGGVETFRRPHQSRTESAVEACGRTAAVFNALAGTCGRTGTCCKRLAITPARSKSLSTATMLLSRRCLSLSLSRSPVLEGPAVMLTNFVSVQEKIAVMRDGEWLNSEVGPRMDTYIHHVMCD